VQDQPHRGHVMGRLNTGIGALKGVAAEIGTQETRLDDVEASVTYLNETAQPQIAELSARIVALEGATTFDITPVFSQPSGGFSATGLSAPFPLPRAGDIQHVFLAAATASTGGPATVQYLVDDLVVATLQLVSGSTDLVTSTLVLACDEGAELRVNATEVGSTTPAMGLLAGFYVTG
jgi:hypothetical protein